MTGNLTERDAGRVIVVGSINVDLVTRVVRHPRPGETLTGAGLSRLAGGKGANQAVAAAEAGARVAMVAAVGGDEGGRAYARRLAERGVDTSQVRTVETESTGHALISISADGENTIVVIPGANGTVTAEVAVESLRALQVGERDVVLMVLEVPLETIAEAAREAGRRGARVVLNLAPYADLPADVLALADPVIVNEHEAEQLSASGLRVEADRLLVTLGGEGARWGQVQVPAAAVDHVVDTTGAGDAFCGALAAALAAGAEPADALARASAAGASAVGREGAQSGPTL